MVMQNLTNKQYARNQNYNFEQERNELENARTLSLFVKQSGMNLMMKLKFDTGYGFNIRHVFD